MKKHSIPKTNKIMTLSPKNRQIDKLYILAR